MLNDKEIISFMKKYYKRGGYKVMELDGKTIIRTPIFAAVYDTNKLPRCILGLLAEHTGSILTDIAFECRKGMGSQLILKDAFEAETSFIWNEKHLAYAFRTPLWWEDKRIFQKEDMTVVAVSGDTLRLVDDPDVTPLMIRESTIMLWQSDDQELYIHVQTSSDNAQLGDLQFTQWKVL